MSEDEALKVVGIALTADGGCSHCVGDQMKQLFKAFPEFDWVALAQKVDPEYEWHLITPPPEVVR